VITRLRTASPSVDWLEAATGNARHRTPASHDPAPTPCRQPWLLPRPDEDPSLALSQVTGAASQTTVLNDHGKHNPIAELADFLKPELQLLVRGKPLLKHAANGRPSLERSPNAPPVEGRIFGEAVDHRVEITTIRSLKRPAHKLAQVGVVDCSDITAASIPLAATTCRSDAQELLVVWCGHGRHRSVANGDERRPVHPCVTSPRTRGLPVILGLSQRDLIEL
jgi:hypothetical protein